MLKWVQCTYDYPARRRNEEMLKGRTIKPTAAEAGVVWDNPQQVTACYTSFIMTGINVEAVLVTHCTCQGIKSANVRGFTFAQNSAAQSRPTGYKCPQRKLGYN